MISEGKHKAQVRDISWDLTSKGTEQLSVLFEVVEGPNAREVITWYGYFTDGTAKRTIESLRAAGWTGDDLAALTVADLPVTVQLVVEHEEDERGAKRARVRWVNSLNRNPMPAQKLAALAGRMKGLASSVKAASGPVKRAPATPFDDFDGDDNPPY